VSKLKELEKRLQHEPENLGLRVALATAYREVARLADAVDLYRSVAIAYRDQGRVQQAMAVCKSVLELVPHDQASLALLATLTPPPPPPLPPLVEKADPEVDPEVGTLVAAPVIPSLTTRPMTAPEPPEEPAPPASARRSSFDETPLPRALPYHVHDPTTRSLKKLSEVDLVTEEEELPLADNADTRPGGEEPSRRSRTSSVAGLANAARRISASLVGSAGDSDAVDVAAALDTRQRPKVPPADLERLSRPPPTVPFERPEDDDVDDVDDDRETPVPGVEHRDEDQTQPRELPGVRQRAPTSSILTTPFFAPLPTDRRAGILARFQRRSLPGGTTVIRQGEVAHPLVLVSRGRLDVRTERGGETIQIGTIAMGEYVGEVALLNRTPSNAHVVAAGEAEVLLLPPRDFYELAGAFPALWAELKDVAERRQREFEYRIRAGRP
jgi:hypothetical protein